MKLETPVTEKPKKPRTRPLTQEELRNIRTQLLATEDVVVSYDREMLIRIVDAALIGVEKAQMSKSDMVFSTIGRLFGG